jgi:hypothetical protein
MISIIFIFLIGIPIYRFSDFQMMKTGVVNTRLQTWLEEKLSGLEQEQKVRIVCQ